LSAPTAGARGGMSGRPKWAFLISNFACVLSMVGAQALLI